MMSWHNTAKSFGSCAEVNTAVVQGSIVFLPGEASMGGVGRFQSLAACSINAAMCNGTSQAMVPIDRPALSRTQKGTRTQKV